MSTIVKPPNSKKFHADFYTPTGKHKRLSTRVEDPTAAKVVSGHCELLSRKNHKKKLSYLEVWQSAEILSKALDEKVCGPCLVSEYLPRLATQLGGSFGHKSIKELLARRMVEYFTQMGEPEKCMWDVETVDARAFMQYCTEKYTLQRLTLRTYGQALHVMWKAALDDKKVKENIWDKVKLPKRPKTSSRRPFTEDELRILYNGADEEWRGMVVVGICTGLRISDVSLLLRRDVDLSTGMVRTKALKPGEFEVKPIPPSVLKRFRKYCEDKGPDAPLFPRAYKWRIDAKTPGRLSFEFRVLLERLGLRVKGQKARGLEQIGANKYAPLTFHCLRHNYVTLVQILGASQGLAGQLAGQKSAAVIAVYSHFTDAHLRNAVKDFPDPFAGLDEQALNNANQLEFALDLKPATITRPKEMEFNACK
jgi:integrase